MAFAVQDFLVSIAQIEDRGMMPTLSGGALCVVEKLSLKLYKYNRGQVVGFRHPNHPKRRLHRRLIGIEGDWLVVPGQRDLQKVPKGHCWVESDTQGTTSQDSPSALGPIPLALLDSVVTHVLWPPSQMGRVAMQPVKNRIVVTGDLGETITDKHWW